MRAFLGVPLPRFEALVQLVDGLRSSGADLKVVDPGQFHLTVQFLGEVRPELAEAFLEGVKKAPKPGAFDVAVKDVGAFPNWKRFHILWAGIEDPTGGLTKLNDVAKAAWSGLGGVVEDRKYSPHLTIARVRSDKGVEAAKAVMTEHRGLAFGTAHVDRMTLYRSNLTAAGPVYETIGEVPL